MKLNCLSFFACIFIVLFTTSCSSMDAVKGSSIKPIETVPIEIAELDSIKEASGTDVVAIFPTPNREIIGEEIAESEGVEKTPLVDFDSCSGTLHVTFRVIDTVEVDHE